MGQITYSTLLDGCVGEGVMSFEEAMKIYEKIVEIATKDGEVSRALSGLIERAIAYSEYRLRWNLMKPQERCDEDAERTRKHNLFIKAKDEVLQLVKKEDVMAFFELQELIGSGRKRVGDWACYIACIYSVYQR